MTPLFSRIGKNEISAGLIGTPGQRSLITMLNVPSLNIRPPGQREWCSDSETRCNSVIKSKCLRNDGANEDVRAEGIRTWRGRRVAFTEG